MKDTKEKIIEYTTKKFLKSGFYKTGMDKLAKEMKISKKTIYKYFNTKSELVQASATYYFDSLREQADKIVSDKKIGTLEKMILLTKMHTEKLRLINEKYYEDLRTHEPHLHKDCEKMQNESINKITLMLLDQGKKEKVFENYPSELLLETVNSLMKNLFNPEYIKNSKYNQEKIFTFMVNLLLNGILTKDGKSKYKNIIERKLK